MAPPPPGPGSPVAAAPRTAVVVGGGIAGLSAAWALSSSAPGLRVVVLEAGDRLGGKLLTSDVGGRPVDLGPDAFLARRPEAVGLCRELGLGDELVSPGSRAAFVWSRRRLRALPGGLALGVPTRLVPLARSGILSPLGLARAALDLTGWPFVGGAGPDGGDLAVADITRRRLGREATAKLVDPLLGGIHAGDTARLSAAAVFPPLLEAARHGGSLMRALRSAAAPPRPAGGGAGPGSAGPGSAGSGSTDDTPVFLTVRDGLGSLVDRLADALRARGVELRTGCRVEHIGLHRGPGAGAPGGGDSDVLPWALGTTTGTVEADAVVVATPAGAAAALLAEVDAGTASRLAAIDYAAVTLVTLRLPDGGAGTRLDGTGFLVPAAGGGLVTACTWLTSKWPHLRRPGDLLLRASAGRYGDDRAGSMTDDEVVAAVIDELRPIMGIREPPMDTVVTRWPGAFPQYTPGHRARVAAIEAGVARLPSLALAGAALHGVGIPACIGSGRRAAAAVLHAAIDEGAPTVGGSR
jgi:oxygen-dependent protoporphyrinogen oxidase